MKSFYYVYNPGNRGPSVKHNTLEEAVRESERLAAKEPGKQFYVLKAVAFSHVHKPVATFYMTNDADNTDASPLIQSPGSRPIQAKMSTDKMDGDDIYAQEIKENQSSKPKDAEQPSGKGLDETPCSALSEIPDKNARWVVQQVIWKKGYLARLMREEAERLESCYEIGKDPKYAESAAKYRYAADALKPNDQGLAHRCP